MKKPTIYKRIVIEGFQSIIKPLVFQLDRQGVNLIVGENGVGKSTIFNALLWCEYQSNMKKSVQTWDDLKPDNYRGTRVVVDRTDGEYDYRVARHLGFTGTTIGLKGNDKLMLFKKRVDEPSFLDEHLLGAGLHKEDMQAMIVTQIGASEKVYTNSILFGQRVASLIETRNEDKRKLFEEMFDVAFVEQAKEKAKVRSENLLTEITSINTVLISTERHIAQAKERVMEQEKVLKDFDEKKKLRVGEARRERDEVHIRISPMPLEIENLKKEISKYDSAKYEKAQVELALLKTGEDAAKEELRGALRRIEDVKSEIARAERRLAEYEQSLKEVKDNCPTCKQTLQKKDIAATKKAIKDSIKKEKDVVALLRSEKLVGSSAASVKVNDEAVSAAKKRESKEEELKVLTAGLKGKYDLETSLKLKQASLASLTAIEKSFTAKLKREEDEKPPELDVGGLKIKIKNYEDEMIAASIKKSKSESDRVLVEWWVKKGFGSGGLKAFVFNAMLNQLNIFAHKYAARLGFRVEFTVDMKKAQKPFKTLIYRGDKVRDYEDLSGGQRQRVDLCVAFAMYDMLSQGTNINILLMDEVFEGLDVAGVEIALELIRQQGESKAVYVITHNDKIDVLNCRTINVEVETGGNTIIM